MPGMNGEQTFNMLRVLNPGVKVLLASGYSINESAHKMLEQGAEGFLKKPFNLIKLSQKMREILDQEKNSLIRVAHYN
jgi:DNA-binding NtrC family response regulator